MKKLHIFRIILFSSIILIPILTMNLKENQLSEIDNRVLTNFSDIKNGNIANNIENYIEDRIGFRDKMVSAYTIGMDKLFNDMVHPSYQYGEEGYIFAKLTAEDFNSEFQEVFSSFIADFEKYCIDRDIKFLYTAEPSKPIIYNEFLPKGFNYKNKNFEYFLSLLKEKNVNFLYNGDTLLEAKKTTQVYDKKYDAGHWNETGALIGISAILNNLNSLDARIETLDINNYKKVEHTNTTLPVSYFPIFEKTIHYNLINDNSTKVNDYNDEIKISSQYRTFAHYKNDNNIAAPKLLVFAGSYFNGKDKFLTESFSEYIKVHNYHNVINYDYYINVFNPDIVLFESTEYTHTNTFFPVDLMKTTIYNKAFNLYNINTLSQYNFAYPINEHILNKSNTNISNFSIELAGEAPLYAYADINGRILDCRIINNEGKISIEFSVKTSELNYLDKLSIYLISNSEREYCKLDFIIE
ncbi:alginate O-acetyltransferase [Clostridium isatidis]|uniref:alginate O-acetyltransferase n=1 Tax=Clostridium isatidis TaxID=182773 RepID=UPI003AAF560E